MSKVEGKTQREKKNKHASGEFLANHYEGRTPPVAAVESFERSMRESDDAQQGED